jgi:alpha-1,3-rhamnosyl/mannosyltransferase
MPNLRVGLNALFVVPGVVGGSEDSTVATLTALAGTSAADDLAYTLFVQKAFATRYPEVAAAFETTVMPVPGRVRSVRVAAESSWLAATTRRAGLDLTHHLGGTIPAVRAGPAMVTVHDLQPLDLPENFAAVKVAYLRRALPRTVRAARAVVTPSEFVRQGVIERFDAHPQKVVVVPHGVGRAESGTSEDELRRRYRLAGRWLVLNAITYPHKGHLLLLEAFAGVARRHDDVDLVLCGGEGPSEPQVRELIEHLGLGDRVRRTGRIPRADVDGLLDHAVALAFPSRYEGFGLPVVEAMSRGCPVVAAATTALPEVVADGGVLLDPDDVGAWQEALLALLGDEAERRRLAAAGRARAARLSWASTAAELTRLHRRAAGGDSEAGLPHG